MFSCALSLILTAGIAATVEAAGAPAPSPAAATELICPDLNSANCYPAIFSPSQDFEVIREGQTLPPGLYVRLNLATGLKEAKLAVLADENPEAERDIDLVGTKALSVEDLETLDGNGGEHIHYASDRIQDLSSGYQAPILGYVDKEDGKHFLALVNTILSAASATVEELKESIIALTELVHDAELGLSFAQNAQLTSRILQILDPSGKGKTAAERHVPSDCALLLGTALQNNQEALQAFLGSFEANARQPATVVGDALEALSNRISQHGSSGDAIQFAARLMFLISQLAVSHSQLISFVHEHGFTTARNLALVDPLKEDSDSYAKLMKKIFHFISDNANALTKIDHHEAMRALCFCSSQVEKSQVQSLKIIEIPARQAQTALEGSLGSPCGSAS